MANPPAKAKAVTTQPRDFHHCFDTMPYRSLVFTRLDGMGKPLYRVAGSAEGETGARKALERAFKVNGGHCYYCKKSNPTDITIDHVEPLAAGGTDTLQNLVVACKPCNAAKNHKPIEIFNPNAGRAWLEALLKQIQNRLTRI
jgi:5-methylcytosine-specific restriction endonuclease McrA